MSSARRIVVGDCVERMAAMPECSVDAVVCDPPYGLEFMGREWDSFRQDAPSPRHRGDRAGGHGRLEGGGYADGTRKAKVAFGGGGKRPSTQRCVECGKRDQFNQPHDPCGAGTWERVTLNPHAAPPSMLAFQAWCEAWAREALRVLKPGGHLLAFGGTRTSHRLTCAIEDAGFEVRDTICWLYGSGFPKSLDVSKAIDKAAGAEREVVGEGRWAAVRGTSRGVTQGASNGGVQGGYNMSECPPESKPATPEAAAWQGWGTALKPAHEPVVVARKPLAGTVAGNVLAHGTGALNVDGCRIEHASADDLATSLSKNPGRSDTVTSGTYGADRPQQSVNVNGRWPANVVLDEEAAALLDEQAPMVGGGFAGPGSNGIGTGQVYGDSQDVSGFVGGFGDAPGGASRFFYVAKASSAERNAGLNGFDKRRAGIGDERPSANVHPTVKPVELMRWLVRLVTPPGGTVLDPFAGSGTTGCAAALEGFRFIGIEREAEYAAIAEARIAWWEQHPEGVEIVKALEADRVRQKVADSGQLGLL